MGRRLRWGGGRGGCYCYCLLLRTRRVAPPETARPAGRRVLRRHGRRTHAAITCVTPGEWQLRRRQIHALLPRLVARGTGARPVYQPAQIRFGLCFVSLCRGGSDGMAYWHAPRPAARGIQG
nr:unnamed protein product [Digitaria exilis]